MPIATKTLLIANLAIFFSDVLFFDHFLVRNFSFIALSAIQHFHLWEFITFQFLHASVGHILFNSIALFFFGPFVERHLGTRRFVAFYLLCGIAGALCFTGLTYAGLLPNGLATGMVGASAGIYGVLIAIAVIAPGLRVSLLFPPVTLTMRTLALIILGISVGSILFRFGGNEGGEAGHLGGAILGFIFARNPRLLDWADPSGRKSRPSPRRSAVPRAPDSRTKLRPRSQLDLEHQSRLDSILDKISSHGFQGLNQDEKEFLQKASSKKSDD